MVCLPSRSGKFESCCSHFIKQVEMRLLYKLRKYINKLGIIRMYILVILLSFLVILICVKLDTLLGVSLLYPCAFIVLFLISLAEIGLLVKSRLSSPLHSASDTTISTSFMRLFDILSTFNPGYKLPILSNPPSNALSFNSNRSSLGRPVEFKLRNWHS